MEVRYGTLRYGTVSYGTLRYGTVHCMQISRCYFVLIASNQLFFKKLKLEGGTDRRERNKYNEETSTNY